jgi:hypothetical protein
MVALDVIIRGGIQVIADMRATPVPFIHAFKRLEFFHFVSRLSIFPR